MKTLTIGILAHVDAGKTTLSEAMLYRAGCSARWAASTTGMRSSTRTRRSVSAASRSFPSGCARSAGLPLHSARHAGPRRLFGGDGADAANSGLRHPRHQRDRRRTGPHLYALGSAAALSGAGVSVCQQDGSSWVGARGAARAAPAGAFARVHGFFRPGLHGAACSLRRDAHGAVFGDWCAPRHGHRRAHLCAACVPVLFRARRCATRAWTNFCRRLPAMPFRRNIRRNLPRRSIRSRGMRRASA